MYYPNLPNVRFVVNEDAQGRPADLGDSTFFTGIQAHIFVLQGRYDEARILQNGPRKIDYRRHPDLLDRKTSMDMELIWDLNWATWPKVFDRPPFHWDGYEYWPPRQPYMFWIATLLMELSCKLKEHENHYKNNLLLMRAATTYRRTRSLSLLVAMRKYVKRLEGMTVVGGKIFPNPWFDYLCENEPGPCLWVDNAHEWAYQRDPRDGNRDGGIFGPGQRKFHRERALLPDGTLTEPLDLTHQFARIMEARGESG